MKRVNIVVEGQAEETFVNEVLAKYLTQFGVFLTPRRVEFGRKKGHIYRGGLIKYLKLKKDVVNWLNQDSEAVVTTMVDLYALPSEFPGRESAAELGNPHDRVAHLEKAFTNDINSHRLIPYIQLHEFEAILFTDISKLSSYYPDFAKEIQSLVTSTSGLAPEAINEGEETAPSKRILNKVPTYDKVTGGSVLAIELTLPLIRAVCPHFSEWIAKLEALGAH